MSRGYIQGYSAAALVFCLALAASAADADKPDVPQLIKQLSSDDAFVRLKAAKTLGETGAAAQAAARDLRKLLNDPDEDVRAIAAVALRKIAGPPAASGPAPSPADIEVLRVTSLYCKGHVDPIRMQSTPSRRLYLVRVRNNARAPVGIDAMKLTWLGRTGEAAVDSEPLKVSADLLAPGAESVIVHSGECTDSQRRFTLTVQAINAPTLSQDELAQLQRNEQARRRLSASAEPLRDFLGLFAGDAIRVRYPDADPVQGVRIALLGYDQQKELVRISVYHVSKLVDRDTLIEFDARYFEKFERARKLADMEELAEADRQVDVVRYDAEILGVGVTKRQH